LCFHTEWCELENFRGRVMRREINVTASVTPAFSLSLHQFLSLLHLVTNVDVISDMICSYFNGVGGVRGGWKGQGMVNICSFPLSLLPAVSEWFWSWNGWFCFTGMEETCSLYPRFNAASMTASIQVQISWPSGCLFHLLNSQAVPVLNWMR